MTKQQLTLIDAPPEWRLDERTRRLGRVGVAKARAALMMARRLPPEQADGDRSPASRTPGSRPPTSGPAASRPPKAA